MNLEHRNNIEALTVIPGACINSDGFGAVETSVLKDRCFIITKTGIAVWWLRMNSVSGRQVQVGYE